MIKVNYKDAEEEIKDTENLENSFNSVGFIGPDISAIIETTTEEIENSIVQENSKGQLFLKCPFGVFKSLKNPMNFFQGFLP